MEETKIEKQNRMLKIVLLVLLIPIVAVVSILAYHFLTKSSDSDDLASKEKRTQKVSRSEPNEPQPSPAAAAATPAIVNTATPTATPANTPTPKTQDSSLPFLGKWIFTNPGNGEKITHIFRTPKKIGNSETGNWLLIEPYGKENSSTYRVSGINRLQVKYEGSNDWVDCSYDVYNNGKSMNFVCDGNPSMALTRSR